MALVKAGVYVQQMDISIMVMPARTWQEVLHHLFLTRYFEINGHEDAQRTMQELYPGPYTVELYINEETHKHDYRLKFLDPEQETLWILKNSV